MLHLCFTCCDNSTAIVFRMTWLFNSQSVAIMIVVDGRGEDMATELWPPVHLSVSFIIGVKLLLSLGIISNGKSYVLCCIDVMNACLICSDCASNNWLLSLPLSMPKL